MKTDDTETAGSIDREALKFFADARDVTGVVLVLESMAEVARRKGTSLRAERLAGAAAAQEATSGAGLGTVVGTREGWRKGAALSDAEAAARADGQAMTLEQAVAYALADEGLELDAREA